MMSKRIAYSLNGEGFGHYGRSIGIIKLLADYFPDFQIDVYCYYNTYSIISKISNDPSFPANISIKKNIGMHMCYNKKGTISFFRTIFLSKSNYSNFFKVFGISFYANFINPIVTFFNKKSSLGYNYTKKYIDDFDFAVVDYEPLLPRVAKIRNKKFITIDSINLLLCGKFYGCGMNLKDWFYRQINKMLTQIEAPLSNPAIITTIYDYPLKKKYQNRIIKVGPLVRNEISSLAQSVVSEDFVLVYVRGAVKQKLLPVIKQVSDYKFVVFTDSLSEKEKNQYFVPHIEFHDIDPIAFPDYFRRCRAIISASGYTSISEAVVLNKPFFAVSIGGVLAFEQRLSLNALCNSGCGDGCTHRKFNKKRLTSFLANLDKYQQRLKEKNYQDDTNHVAQLVIEMIKKELKI